MNEIEVKAALTDKQSFIEALSNLGCELGKEISQDDTVYARTVGSLDEYLSNSDFLRLRVQNDGKILFTFKHHSGRIINLDSAPLELELEISSRDTMEKMLALMGYKEAVRIKKLRRKTKYQNWEICVDEVEGLGSFVELEELTEENDRVQEVQERMEIFLAKLGVDAESLLKNRYDVMLMQKQAKD